MEFLQKKNFWDSPIVTHLYSFQLFSVIFFVEVVFITNLYHPNILLCTSREHKLEKIKDIDFIVTIFSHNKVGFAT